MPSCGLDNSDSFSDCDWGLPTAHRTVHRIARQTGHRTARQTAHQIVLGIVPRVRPGLRDRASDLRVPNVVPRGLAAGRLGGRGSDYRRIVRRRDLRIVRPNVLGIVPQVRPGLRDRVSDLRVPNVVPRGLAAGRPGGRGSGYRRIVRRRDLGSVPPNVLGIVPRVRPCVRDRASDLPVSNVVPGRGLAAGCPGDRGSGYRRIVRRRVLGSVPRNAVRIVLRVRPGVRSRASDLRVANAVPDPGLHATCRDHCVGIRGHRLSDCVALPAERRVNSVVGHSPGPACHD